MNKYAQNTSMNTHSKSDFEIIMDSGSLNGTNRFVADGLLTQNECKVLLEIAARFALKGDGYKGDRSPHTEMESFEGISVGRTALLLYLQRIESSKVNLFLKSTDNAKQLLEKYFKLRNALYFTYTHLVCRSAIIEGLKNRTDLSHAIHADNCNILEAGLCPKTPPAFTWRDYSAIIYLNNDFEGGEFVFAQDMFGKTIQSSVKPKCGRMIGFSSGSENLHGVRAVKSGSRCAIALWFTFNKKYEEKDRHIALKIIAQKTHQPVE